MCFSDLVFLTLPHWVSHAVLVSSVAPCWPAPCPNHWTAAEPGRSSSSSAHAVTRTRRKWPRPGVETWRAARLPFSLLRRSGTRWWEAPASAPRPRPWSFCLERTEAHQRSGWFSGGWKTRSAWARSPTRSGLSFSGSGGTACIPRTGSWAAAAEGRREWAPGSAGPNWTPWGPQVSLMRAQPIPAATFHHKSGQNNMLLILA